MPENHAEKPEAQTAAAVTQVDESVIERTILLLVTLRSRADVLRAIITSLRLTEVQGRAALDEAVRRISLTAAVDYDQEVGRSLLRLDELYQIAATGKDVKMALAIQRERAKLLGLYGVPLNSPAEASTSLDPDTGSAAIAELAAVRERLAPLVGAAPDEATDEIARRVVARFVSQPRVS